MNNSAIGSSLESFLEEENIKDDVESNAVKKIIALQMQENLKHKSLTKNESANRLTTALTGVL